MKTFSHPFMNNFLFTYIIYFKLDIYIFSQEKYYQNNKLDLTCLCAISLEFLTMILWH
jgi:hypothetical protein